MLSNRRQVYAILCILLIAGCLFVSGAAARYSAAGGDNAGIDPGDTVYIGELNLNFSAFQSGTKIPQNMVKYESGAVISAIPLTNMIGSITSGTSTGRYYPDYGGGNIDQSISIDIRDPALGQMKLYVYGTDVTPDGLPARPSEIARQMNVMFYMPDSGIVSSQLNGYWYEYQLTGTKGSTKRITNSAGTIINLDQQTTSPSQPDANLAFQLAKQSVIPTGNSTASMTFRLKLNGLSTETTYSFTAADFGTALTVDKSRVQQSDSLTLTLTGTPFTSYTLKLSPASSGGPYFAETAGDTRPNPQEITLHPEWNGRATAVIEVPAGASSGEYQIETTDPGSGLSRTASFTVTKSGATMEFEEPSDDVKGGKFSVGDAIRLRGTCKNTNEYVPVYLYLTGPNLPANGVNLITHQEVIDGDVSTFTTTAYDPTIGYWEYIWWTKGLEPGTYTVHANLNPYGHTNSDYPGGTGNIDGKVPPAWDYPLSEQTIQVKASDKSGGYFAKGDNLYSWWIARGSPGIGSATSLTGEVRWYIFGSNFRYADRQTGFPLYQEEQDPWVDAPWGEYGFTYDRNFTYTLSSGVYYLVYQHPGPNGVFDVEADDGYGKALTTVRTTYGSSASFTTMQGKNAADALTKMFTDPKCDDLYVMTEFTVEEPYLTMNDPGQIAVGDKLIISGRTNLAAADESADETDVDDKLFLSIHRIDENLGEESNTAMKIPTTTTIPKSPVPFKGYRTYSFDEIDTSSWYPGIYEASVECKDAKFSKGFSFEILAQGASASGTTVRPTISSSLSATEKATPYPTYTSTSSSGTSTPAPTTTPYPTQTPGFGSIAATLGAILALTLRRKLI